ncbi:MAG TPA: polysaccharide biosynthesis/export family protein [Blastocatellia bacterium]|nr:polysaccharide biosynthesis/export family protein [Blastocatellia bacterium]
MKRYQARRIINLSLAAALCCVFASSASAQTASKTFGDSPRDKPGAQATGASATPALAYNEAEDQMFRDIYRGFYETYKIGPSDEIAIRIVNQPDYSLERVEVSPVGRIFHPLLGEVEVVGLTVPRLKQKLLTDLSQYIIDPNISVSLIKANSAKIGVLGDINRPGILVMSGPMTVLDAISASGGVSSLGSQSNITLVRQVGGGQMRTMKVNVKRILEGKASPEENVRLQAGDTLIVHGNLKKKIGSITSIVGFGRFMDFILR